MKRFFTLFLFLPFFASATRFFNQEQPVKSITQEQSAKYAAYKFTTEAQWDELRMKENGPGPVKLTQPQGGCVLQKRVFGWHPYWAGSAYNNYDWQMLTDLSFFSYEVDANSGNAITNHGWATANVVSVAQANSVKVNLCATLFSNHATFLTNATSRQTFISNIISDIQLRNANGCNIDFEGVPSAQSANFTAFMIDLCNQMHATIPNSEISIALPAVDWSNVYDVASMVPYVDLFIIMGYDYYWSGSTTAGPTDPLYNFVTTYNYTLTKSITYYLNDGVPNAKLLLGIPYYGREWPTSASTIPSSTTGSGTARVYNFVRNNASGNYSTQQWDANSYTPYYIFNSGGWNQCFCNSAYSLGRRYDIVNEFGIGGIGIWALSYDDGYNDLWNKIRDKFSDCPGVPCTDTIYDMGGPNRNYYNDEDYTYTIAPTGATAVTLSFSSFNTEAGWDFLRIYDGPSIASPLIGTFDGTNSPGTITSTGGSITLRWTSDVSTVSSGWSATWSCSTALPANLFTFSDACPQIGVTLNWTNSGNGWFVDVSDDPGFSYFWNKDVTGQITESCPGGFCLYPSCTSYLKFEPGTTYYWRIWDGSGHTYGPPFTTPICAYSDTGCSGTIDDSGGPSAPYSGNEDYTFTISPVSASSVTINFSSFDLETNFDSLYIHDGTTITSPLLGAYTGTSSPGTISSTGSAMTLHFISDPFVNNAGFAANWSCNLSTGISQEEQNEFSIYPNPSNGIIQISNIKYQKSKVEIYNTLGEKIFSSSINSPSAVIDMRSLTSGIYFLKLVSEQKRETIKLVKE